MVLQQDMPVPVWGWAEAGEDVTVSIDAQTQSAKAAAELRIDSAATWIMPSSERPLIENFQFHVARLKPFAQTLSAARGINVEGTRRLLELTSMCDSRARWLYVSTAFVAGQRTGMINELDPAACSDFVNAYEQSKAEAEHLVAGGAPGDEVLQVHVVGRDLVAAAGAQHGRLPPT